MDQPPDGSIVITPKEFYDGVRQDISDIKTAVAPLSTLSRDVEDLKLRLDRVSDRVNNLEARIWRASGFAAAVGIAAGWLIPQWIGQ